MEISNELKRLATKLKKKGKTLYIVGGYVRDFLCGYTAKDIDITSDATIEEIEEIAKELKLTCKVINKKLGTVHISSKKETWEYTQFRKDSYSTGHTPDSVEFVHDIETDAKRRDLTINAIYYDISSDTIVDPLNGEEDLKKKILRTANDPNITFRDDGIRILRAIRFASMFGFKFEKKTFHALCRYKSKLLEISKERILNELSKCVQADLIYGIYNECFMKLCIKLKLLPYIFTSTLNRMKKPRQSDIDGFYATSKESRLMALYILIMKNMQVHHMKENQLAFLINSIFGLEGIKESKENIRMISRLFMIYQNAEYQLDSINSSINYLSLLDLDREIILNFLSTPAKKYLFVNISIIRGCHLPLSIYDLDITSEDLISAGIKNVYINKILSTLYNQVVELQVENQKDELLNLALAINSTFMQITENKE